MTSNFAQRQRSNTLLFKPAGQSTLIVRSLVLLVLLSLAAPHSSVSAWRLFDFSSADSSAARSLYASPLQAPGSLAGFNPTLSSQLLVPISSIASSQQQIQQPANEPLRSAPVAAPPPSFSSLVAPAASGLIQSAVEQALNLSIPDPKQQVESRDASSIPAVAQRSAEKQTGNELESKSSPAGKILEVLSAAATGSGSASNVTATSKVVDKVVGQMLKPRNKSSPPTKTSSASSAEQQIINQHARVHHFQRLSPTKQRDTKISSYLDSSGFSSSSNQQRDSSALATILNNIKLSGFSNRNSIVKAISDNKLGRSKYE